MEGCGDRAGAGGWSLAGLIPVPPDPQTQGCISSTWTPLLTAGFHLLSCALARVALRAGSLAHAEATLPARVTCLGAQAPRVPRPPLAVSGYERREV